MCDEHWVAIEAEIDAELAEQAARKLAPLGFTLEAYLKLWVNFPVIRPIGKRLRNGWRSGGQNMPQQINSRRTIVSINI